MKYHISKAGNPAQCKATKKGCPLGEDAPHFDSKDAAQQYIEKTEKEKNYAFKSFNKGSKINDNISLLENLPVDKSHEGSSDELENYYENYAPGFNVIESVDRIEDNNDTILEKDGLYYLSRATFGYKNLGVMSVQEVVKAKAKQINTKETFIPEDGSINDEEILSMLKEIRDHSNNNKKFIDGGVYDYQWDESDYVREIKIDDAQFIVDGSSESWEQVIEIEREDGSKIIIQPLKGIADRGMTDAPGPVKFDDDFEENGQLYNMREMTTGKIYFDTRSNKGVLLKVWSGSEGGDDHEFIIDSKGLRRKHKTEERFYKDSYNDYSVDTQRLYLIEGDGSVDTDYWKPKIR